MPVGKCTANGMVCHRNCLRTMPPVFFLSRQYAFNAFGGVRARRPALVFRHAAAARKALAWVNNGEWSDDAGRQGSVGEGSRPINHLQCVGARRAR